MIDAAPDTRRAPAKRAAKSKSLPPVGIARFTEATRLIEELIQEKTDVFLAAAARYRESHQQHGTPRMLTHTEALAAAAQLAGELADVGDPATYAAQIQQSELRALDEPQQQELLLAAGLGTASAFLDVALTFVALIEMPKARFDEERQGGTLRDAIDEDVDKIKDDDRPVAEIRERAVRAFEHFASAGGEDRGKAVGLIKDLIRQALTTAMAAQESSGPLLSTVSPPSTDGDSGN